MNNLNLSFDGLFSKIEALKEQSTKTEYPKENAFSKEEERFPKFNPMPPFKSQKSTLDAKSFDRFFDNFKPLAPKQVIQKKIDPYSIPKKSPKKI